MSIDLPVATCRVLGHAWVVSLNYDTSSVEQIEICSRCGTLNQSRHRDAPYVPRHLRER